ncbi:MAG TPA: cupredoxin domain-containing protein [Rhodocyclaceae bacterium]|nr:cupredoxin domain-containing protein [Rhodocyclaceae bacterium]
MNATPSHFLLLAGLWLGLGGAADGHAQELPTFEVIAKDGRLTPQRLEVPSGQRVKLVVKNEGKGPIEFENLNMRVEKVLAPGATSFVVLPKLKPGEYEFIDEFHMDTAKMKVIAR